MRTEPRPRLGPHEHLVCAFPKPSQQNSPVVLVIFDRESNSHRIDYLQPEHFRSRPVLQALYSLGWITHQLISTEVLACLERPRRIRKPSKGSK